jgi:hypothetical protein
MIAYFQPLARIGESAQFGSASRPLANLRRIGVPSSCEVLGCLEPLNEMKCGLDMPSA